MKLIRPYTATVNQEQERGDRIVTMTERFELNPKRCLDVGCGRGYLLQQLQVYNFCPILGLELPGVPEIAECVSDPADVTGEYDLIICAFTLERVDDPAESLAWMKSKLTLGGTLLVEDTIGDAYTRPEFEKLIATLGLPYLYLDFEIGCDIFIGERYADAKQEKVLYTIESPDLSSNEQYVQWLMKQYGKGA